MKHEKIIKRDDGTQYQIIVNIANIGYDNSVRYSNSVYTRQKGKKKWNNLPNIDEYKYRALSIDDRIKHTEANNLRFVSKEEILEAKLEAWMKIKPI